MADKSKEKQINSGQKTKKQRGTSSKNIGVKMGNGMVMNISLTPDASRVQGTQLSKTSERRPSNSFGNEITEQTAKSYAAIATQVWLAKRRIINPDTGEPREGLDRIFKHIERIFQALLEDDVEINGYDDGGIYDAGMVVKALTFEPTPGLSREMIKETLRPTVIYKKRQVLQQGEVIVGTPMNEQKKEGGSDDDKNND